MKVENNSLNRLTPGAENLQGPAGAHNVERGGAGQPAGALTGKDQASFSERARLLAQTRAALGEQPETRAERVDELRRQVNSGNYEIPLDELARRLVQRQVVSLPAGSPPAPASETS